MNEFLVALWIAAGVALLIGLLAGWLFGGAGARRGQQDALRQQVEEAKAQALQMARDQAEATLRPQIATADERARGLAQERDGLRGELQLLRTQADALRDALDKESNERAQLAERAERVPVLDAELARLRIAHQSARDDAGALRTQIGELNTRMDAERQEADKLQRLQREQTAVQLQQLVEAREVMANQFKALANDILEEKSKRFAEQNQTSLGTLLDPLRLRLADFQGKVEQFYDTEGKQRSALSQQVTQLMELNQLLGAEARNLTQALKGSSKTQGNWGELILERVLEASGLRRGVEYHTQQSHTREDGSRAQPDVIIHLPEERRLVVDAKVSLVAYEECVSAETDELRAAAQRRHLASIRSHIDGLSAKRYEQLYGLKSLDFVLMFVPIEPAFMLAISADDQLFMDAWSRNVLLVSPSTLLFVVRTVAHLWRQEHQSRNAQDIARRGAELYDKLAAFVADLERVGKALDNAQGAYKDAFNKFTDGKGNAIRQAEMLKALGVKPTKVFSVAALDAALPLEGTATAPEQELPAPGLPAPDPS